MTNSEENTTIPSDFEELMAGGTENPNALDQPELIDPEDEAPVLRCNRCNTPITPQTAVLTPTGYRCKACVRGQQKVFDTSQATDPIIAFFIAALISFGGSWLVAPLGFIIILVATGLGLLIYRTNRLALKRRRGKRINLAVLIGAIVGASPLLIRQIIVMTQTGDILSGAGRIIWYIVYAGLVAASAYAQSKGARN